jgi:hypothetical protein
MTGTPRVFAFDTRNPGDAKRVIETEPAAALLPPPSGTVRLNASDENRGQRTRAGGPGAVWLRSFDETCE